MGKYRGASSVSARVRSRRRLKRLFVFVAVVLSYIFQFFRSCTAQHSTAQHSKAQHSTAQHSTTLYSILQYVTFVFLQEPYGVFVAISTQDILAHAICFRYIPLSIMEALATSTKLQSLRKLFAEDDFDKSGDRPNLWSFPGLDDFARKAYDHVAV